MSIELKSEEELRCMREAGQIVGQTLSQLREMIRPGLNLLEIEKFVREEFKRRGAKETFYHYTPDRRRYTPYPSNICISVNEQLVHGIPRNRQLEEGDIVSLDLGATYKGFVGDAAITVGVGNVSVEARRLMEVTEQALWAGIRAAKPHGRLNEVRTAIEEVIRCGGYSVVTGYGGHGVGRRMHEEPHIENVRGRFKGPELRPGMAIALEPMVNIGNPETEECDDGWTVRTKDGSLCCHFEHTIAIRESGEAEVLTLP